MAEGLLPGTLGWAEAGLLEGGQSERAYHGVNLGGVALSGMTPNRRAFGNVGPQVVHMRHTALPENRFTRFGIMLGETP